MKYSQDQLIIQNAAGDIEEILNGIDYASFGYNYQQNQSRDLSFTVYKIPGNEFAYQLVTNEATVLYHGQQFVIKDCTQIQGGYLYNKQVTAHHISLQFQDWVVPTDSESDKSWQLADALAFISAGNDLGYKLDCVGKWDKAKKLDSLGGNTGTDALNTIVAAFGGLVMADNKHITVYDKDSFYQTVDHTFRYLFNTDNVTVDTSTDDLKTRVKVYGPKKASKDLNYQKVKTKELQKTGVFDKNNVTIAVGSMATATVTVKTTGDSIYFKPQSDESGGLWHCFIDNVQKNDVSCFEGEDSDSGLVADNVTAGTHVVKLVFAGADPNHVVKTPKGLLDADGSTIIMVKASGDSQYNLVTTYVSPNEGLISHHKWAAALTDKKAKNVADLLAYAKKRLKDKPTVTITLSYLGKEPLNEREQWFFMHETLGYSVDVGLVSMTVHHPFYFQASDVSFSNDNKSMVKIQSKWYQDLKSQNNELSSNVDTMQSALEEAADTNNDSVVTPE
ncbi:prophage endopeptidase tail family protein [Lactiplantibacillus carotarum]|uniref:prophage endopeptidase tail family protein n=1 Tax=Lactiplantibacillus carotarum TaxID=2993456 RepID=UPI00298EE3D5|nr:prophage endopeptidase tail family protein [Lactiplantibacillus carotarum]